MPLAEAPAAEPLRPAPGRARGGRDAGAPRARAASRRRVARRLQTGASRRPRSLVCEHTALPASLICLVLGVWFAYDRLVPATATFEDRVRAWEEEFLSEHATRSYPARRAVEEPDSPLRTPFQRDRDRIVHSKSFRRLKHKTQVFVAPEGDHYRTRLTHTLEACGIARTVARALGLNEDLTEAIGLGHDLGHPPFGHAGEDALDAALRERCGTGFKHNEHSLRVVEVLERDGQGLNLTEQVRDGILNHTGADQAGDPGGPDRQAGRPRRLHQPRHRRRPAGRDPAARRPAGGGDRAARADRLAADRHPGPRHRRALQRGAATSSRARRSARRCCGCASSCSTASTSGPRPSASTSGSKRAMRGLFDHYLEHPDELPRRDPGASDCQRVTDYIAGMTDRFCIAKFTELTIPEEAQVLVALISPESLERVKQTADIVEVISAHTDLRRQGARWVGLCPFHEERTPSFSVDAAGKALPLLRLRGRRRRDQVRRGEGRARLRRGGGAAGRPLRGRARARAGGPAGGGQAPAAPPPRAAAGPHRRLLRQLPLGVQGGGQGARVPGRARARARRCCATSASATRPAPGTRSSCAASRPASASRSCAASASSSAGAQGGEYDRFRSRIMFPIRDRRGRTLGFGGRAMRSDQGAKYVNTAETDFFHKSQLLYGVDRAKAAIAKADAGGRGRGLHRRAGAAPGRGRGDGRR